LPLDSGEGKKEKDVRRNASLVVKREYVFNNSCVKIEREGVEKKKGIKLF